MLVAILVALVCLLVGRLIVLEQRMRSSRSELDSAIRMQRRAVEAEIEAMTVTLRTEEKEGRIIASNVEFRVSEIERRAKKPYPLTPRDWDRRKSSF